MTAGTETAARAPDLVVPVVGFRQWRIADGALWSPFADFRWRAGANTAGCEAHGADHPDAPPGHGCTCGLHAWYRPCPRGASAGTGDLVSGAVALWGDIECHPGGMRAQHASVLAVVLPRWPPRKREEASRAAADLRVPSVRGRELLRVALEHGEPLTARWAPSAA